MAINEIVKALQLPEGFTVRKVGNSLRVVAKKKVAIANKERTMRLINEDGTPYEYQQQENLGELNRRHEEAMAAMYAKEKALKAAKERQYAEAFANPPALQGSPKQIAWASKLRAAFIEFYHLRRREYCGDEVLSHTDAAYWIENRYGLGVTNSDQRAIQALIYAK